MNGHHLRTRASVALPVAPGGHQHITEVSQQETQGIHFPLEHPACWASLLVLPGRQAPSSTLLSSSSLCALRQGFQLVLEHSTLMVLDTGPRLSGAQCLLGVLWQVCVEWSMLPLIMPCHFLCFIGATTQAGALQS